MAGPKNAAFAEESAEVEVLLASLSKTTDLTKRIKASLTRLDNSGRIVRDAIGPINSGTQQLQITAANITKINEAIERLRQPMDSKSREESVIHAGPREAGIQQYLAALKRIDRALTDLKSSNLKSNEQTIFEFDSLLSNGVEQLLSLYRGALEEDAGRIEPLTYVTTGLEFPTYSQDKASHLNQIAAAIVSAGIHSEKHARRDADPAVNLYSKIRGDYVAGSLQVSALGSVSTSKRRSNDTSIYARSHHDGVGLYAQALEGMLAAEHQNVSRIFRGEVADRVFAATSAEAMNNFAQTLAELNNIIKSRIMTDCFLAYEILELATPMAYRLEARTGQLKSQFSDALRPIRDTARASLSEILTRTKAQADSVTTLPGDGNTIPLVHDTAKRLQTLALFDKSLSSLLTSIGDNNWRKDPKTLLTSTTTTASSSTLNLDVASPLSPDSSDRLLPAYLLDLLDTLLTSLSARSTLIHRQQRTLQGIFMLNTLAILNRAILTSPELSAYIPPQPQNPKLEPHVKPATASLLHPWREPSTHLFDTISSTTSASTSHNSSSSRPLSTTTGGPDSHAIIKSLNSKDREKIREKFRTFTSLFDDAVARHRAAHLEREVRSLCGREITAIIEPMYARFWDRYREIDGVRAGGVGGLVSKAKGGGAGGAGGAGGGGVVKYSKAEVAAILASL